MNLSHRPLVPYELTDQGNIVELISTADLFGPDVRGAFLHA